MCVCVCVSCKRSDVSEDDISLGVHKEQRRGSFRQLRKITKISDTVTLLPSGPELTQRAERRSEESIVIVLLYLHQRLPEELEEDSAGQR